MQHADDPPRLLEELGDAPDDLRLGLERFSLELPGPERLARLATALGVEPIPPSPQPVPGTRLAAKLAVGAGVVGIAAVVVFFSVRERSKAAGAGSLPQLAAPNVPAVAPLDPARSRGHDAPSQRSAVGPAPPGASTEPSAPREASPDGRGREPARGDAPSGERAVAGRSGEVSSSGSSALTASRGVTDPRNAPSAAGLPAAATVPSETELLRDARLVLERDPSQALAVSEQHRRAYPNGAFSQERELIAVTALVKLGRGAEARSRAERFRQSYPRSAYTERLDRLISP